VRSAAAAERVLRGSSQPVSPAPIEIDSDIQMHAADPREPDKDDLERTMEDYYARTDAENQGGVPTDPPDVNPMPLQDLRKPKAPPQHNM
jgi:hypothetical protein